jgi:hypothetical protein
LGLALPRHFVILFPGHHCRSVAPSLLANAVKILAKFKSNRLRCAYLPIPLLDNSRWRYPAPLTWSLSVTARTRSGIDVKPFSGPVTLARFPGNTIFKSWPSFEAQISLPRFPHHLEPLRPEPQYQPTRQSGATHKRIRTSAEDGVRTL